MSKATRHHTAQSGFTLVEILVVLAIISASAVTIMISASTAKRPPTLAKQAEQVAQMAINASLAARSGRKAVALNVDIETNQISWQEDDLLTLPPSTQIRLTTERDLVESETKGAIWFYAHGGATGGEIVLSNTNSPAQKVNIHWLTGLVTIEPWEVDLASTR